MQDELKITVVQFDPQWHEAEANREHLSKLLLPLAGKTDLIVLPETFTTGFDAIKTKQLAEVKNGPTTRWMRGIAQETKAAVMGSFYFRELNRIIRNRLMFCEINGNVTSYDKIHLFRPGKEHAYVTPGRKRPILKWKGWKILPALCFDLRFPHDLYNTMREGELSYDIMICPASWPAVRMNAWDTLLKARAIENYAYTIGVNRIGMDGNNMQHSGHTQVNSPLGTTIAMLPENKEAVATVTLNKEQLQKPRVWLKA